MKILHIFIVALLISILAFACGSNGKSIEKTLTITTVAKTKYEKASDIDRFGIKFDSPPASQNQTTLSFEYQLPENWSDSELKDKRDVNIIIASAPEVSCYLTVLPIRGGDALMNLNRWRGQFQQKPINDIAEQKSESITFLNIPTKIFEIEGDFSSNNQIKNAYKMYGIITHDNKHAYSLKFIGPSETIEIEKQNFIKWVNSIKIKNPIEETKSKPTLQNAKLTWIKPENWQLEPEKPQRIATFKPINKTKTEITITIFKGSLIDNLNRWRKQMGQSEFAELSQHNLEKISTTLGECFIAKIEGTYNGGMSNNPIADAIIIGGILPRGDSSIFIKMIGPKAEAESELDSLKALILSLKEAQE